MNTLPHRWAETKVSCHPPNVSVRLFFASHPSTFQFLFSQHPTKWGTAVVSNYYMSKEVKYKKKRRIPQGSTGTVLWNGEWNLLSPCATFVTTSFYMSTVKLAVADKGPPRTSCWSSFQSLLSDFRDLTLVWISKYSPWPRRKHLFLSILTIPVIIFPLGLVPIFHVFTLSYKDKGLH